MQEVNIVSMTLKNIDGKWSFSVIRNDNYQELEENNIEPIESVIEELITFAETVKTPEQNQIEELEQKQKETVELLVNHLDEKQLLELVEAFPSWSDSKFYAAGEYVNYDGKLYKVTQSHTSQSSWFPDRSFSLFTEVLPPGTIGDFVQPRGQNDSYQIGDKVIFDGWIWVSIINHNVWSPADYPQGWEKESEVNP